MDTDHSAQAQNSRDPSQSTGIIKAGTGTEVWTQFEYTKTKVVDISTATLRRSRIITAIEPGPYVDAYKVLRTRVLQKMRERGWNALAVTSPTKGAGTSVAAINLAISLALEINQTVLLVDADLRAPSIHKYFGFSPALGLTDYLLDQVPVEDILVHPRGIGRFVILPGSRGLVNSAEMLSSPRMNGLVRELKERYQSRIIVFDLPNLYTADALAFIPQVDAVLMVLESGRTSQTDLATAVESLYGKPIVGSVLNKAEPISAD